MRIFLLFLFFFLYFIFSSYLFASSILTAFQSSGKHQRLCHSTSIGWIIRENFFNQNNDCVDHENIEGNFRWKTLRYDNEGNVLWALCCWWRSLQNRTNSRKVGKFHITIVSFCINKNSSVSLFFSFGIWNIWIRVFLFLK